jgi:hypothetical protein
MQPFISPNDIKLIHDEMIRTHLNRRANGEGSGVLSGIRALIARIFSASGRGVSPAPRQDVDSTVPIILHDGRRRIGELDFEAEHKPAA